MDAQEKFQRLIELPESSDLKEGIKFDSSVQELVNNNLEKIPEWIRDLKSNPPGLSRFIQTALDYLPRHGKGGGKEASLNFLKTCVPYMAMPELYIFLHCGIRVDYDLVDQVAEIAMMDDTVLICGESGTGKDLIAKAIHLRSDRRAGEFIAINCAGMPSALIESELFGHEKGAFTGAIRQNIGYLESAQGGTVFLDEIGDMPIQAQTKLLRALNNREIVRVGGNPKKPIKLDVRIVCATNRNLQEQIKKGEFRSDLYYRISTFIIKMPTLRSLLNCQLIDDFISYTPPFNLILDSLLSEAPYNDLNSQGVRITKGAFEKLIGYQYPGNFRELVNILKRALSKMRMRGPTIDTTDKEFKLAWYEIDENMIVFERCDSSSDTMNEAGLDVSKMSYPEVMVFCRGFEMQKLKELLEKNRGRNVLRLCALEMGLISKNDVEYSIKNKVAALKTKLKKMDIDYEQYQM